MKIIIENYTVDLEITNFEDSTHDKYLSLSKTEFEKDGKPKKIKPFGIAYITIMETVDLHKQEHHRFRSILTCKVNLRMIEGIYPKLNFTVGDNEYENLTLLEQEEQYVNGTLTEDKIGEILEEIQDNIFYNEVEFI